MPDNFDRRRFLSLTAASAAGYMLAPRSMFGTEPDGCARLAAISAKWDEHVRPMLAGRYHRLHHCMFHYVRNTIADMSTLSQGQLTDLRWAAPRPANTFSGWDVKEPYRNLIWATTNGSGEDFLYYHRWMIKMVDNALAKQGVGPLEPWSGKDAIPAPLQGCADEAVPDFTPVFANAADPSKPIEVPWLQERVQQMKSSALYWNRLTWWQNDFRDPGLLRHMSLGELGARLESLAHNQMHIRWSAYPTNGRKQIRDEGDFRPEWDDAGYDTLFDEYSSHVPPNFYRLHKWVDNRIEDWAAAHGRAVGRYRTPHGFDWFAPGPQVQVATPWTGRWGFDEPDAAEQARRVAIMEQVIKVLYPPASVVAATPLAAKHKDVITLRDHIH